MRKKRARILSDKLDTFREENFNPSWNEISKEIGVSSKTLQRWRNGSVPRNPTLEKVESFLDSNGYDNTIKQCMACKEVKERSVDNFQRNKNHLDGLSNTCKVCWNDKHREKNQEYYQKNKKEMLEGNKKWLEDNREDRLEWKRDYYSKNRKKMIKYMLDWQKNNPEAVRIISKRREARLKNLPNTLTIEEWEKSLECFGNSCAYCGAKQENIKETLNQEHIIPVLNGGGYVKDNIIPSCKSCNSSKHARNFEEWYPEQECFSEKRMKKIIDYIYSN